jgi:FKBP-type peptidyl-prolyl cis-trans isomerase SlyD
MQVGPGTVVTMDYTLRLDSGEVVDSSEGREPLVFHFGQGQIIPGLEREMSSMQNGDQKEISVAPGEAYGPRQAGAIQTIPLDRFPKDLAPEAGMHLTVRRPRGEEMPFTIIAVSEELATLDFHHPLAGENLNFSVTVRDVQSAGGGRIILPGEA